MGGQPSGTGFFLGGQGGAGGSGGTVEAEIVGGAVETGGDGAYGVWAQSVGGGGGIGGDIAASDNPLQFPGSTGGDGDGGAVGVVIQGARVTANGANANAVMAQSLGGGGGQVTTQAGVLIGSAGGNGEAGTVGVALTDGAAVAANGAGGAGIYAQSNDGNSIGAAIAVSIDATSSVTGGPEVGAAIVLEGGNQNTIDNAGTISASPDGDAYAIFTDTIASNTTIDNTGTITGTVATAGPGDSFVNRSGGLFETGRSVRLGTAGQLTNGGVISVGGRGEVARTTLTGDLEQRAGGALLVDVDSDASAADLLRVAGAADLAGAVRVNPVTLAKDAWTVLEASDGVRPDDRFAAASTPLFTFETSADATRVTVAADADFRGDGRTDGGARRNLAKHLQGVWDGERRRLRGGLRRARRDRRHRRLRRRARRALGPHRQRSLGGALRGEPTFRARRVQLPDLRRRYDPADRTTMRLGPSGRRRSR